MENTKSNNLKIMNKKMICMSLIVLAITLIMGIVFISNTNLDFMMTRTVWADMTEGIDGDTPGGGELFLISAFVSGLTLVGELTLVLIIIVAYLVIPVLGNAFILINNLIARLFQVGQCKKWKNTVTKILLYISIVLQGILGVYILLLCFTGFGLVYIAIYLMLIINVFGFVKSIINNRKFMRIQ